MSFRVVGKVLRESDETLARRIILFVLAEAASDDGIAWLDQTTIATKARLSRTHVAERLREMDADGVLQIRKAQRGRRRISVYRIVLDGLDAPDYDRLPFVLDRPFDDVGSSDADETATVSDPPADRVGSSGSTVSDPPSPRARDPLPEPSAEPSETPGAALTRRDEEVAVAPPKLTKIDGRDVAFDTLASETGVDPSGNRAREVGLALNGGGPSKLVGIRTLFARQLADAGHAGILADGERFERLLAAAVETAADRYVQVMPGAALTPLALAKWWTDLRRARERAEPRRYGVGVTTETFTRAEGVDFAVVLRDFYPEGGR